MRGTHSLAIQLVLVFPVAPEAPGSQEGLAFQLLLQSLALLRAPEDTKTQTYVQHVMKNNSSNAMIFWHSTVLSA